MNSDTKNALKSAFIAPKPIRKEEFLSNLPYPKATTFEFFVSQLGYIRKRFWCLSVLLLISVVFITMKLQQDKEIIGLLSAVLPLLTLLVITEVSKSMSCNMGELESSCRYDLSKIILLRLTALGTFHFLAVLFMLIILKDHSQYGMVRYSLYAITPFLLSSYLSFWIVNHFKSKDTLYICSGVTAFISLSVFVLNSNFVVLYHQNYTVLWVFTFIIFLILLTKELYFLMNERVGQWNFA